MSRKKKPQRRKSINTSQQEANKPELNPQITRRKWLKRTLSTAGGVATGIVMWRVGLFDVFKDKKETVSPDALDRKPDVPKLPEYDEWAKDIELPAISISHEDFDIKKVLDRPVADEQIGKLKEDLEKIIYEFNTAYNDASATEDKEEVFAKFLNDITGAVGFAVRWGEKKNLNFGTRDFYDYIRKMNSALVAGGYFLSTYTNPETENRSMSLFEVNDINTIEISGDNFKKSFPLIEVNEQKDYYTKSDEDVADLNGRYEPGSSMLIRHEAGGLEQYYGIIKHYKRRCNEGGVYPKVLLPEAKEDFLNSFFFHEGMHAYLDSNGIAADPYRKDALKKSGGANMGRYNIPKEFFRNVDNAQLHELTANGFGLQNSGQSAPLLAHAMITTHAASNLKNYVLMSNIMAWEIVEAPSLSYEIKIKLSLSMSKGTVPVSTMISAINELPIEELHKIGERMTKLGIYLTQE